MRVERGVFNVLYRMLWNAASCQDILHDAFLRLWARRSMLDATHIDALAYTTALNLARNRLRWEKLRHWVGLDAIEDLDAAPHVEENRRADLLDLRSALATLDAADRELLLLSEYAGFETAELATMLGIAPGTVGSRKHRALLRLRAHLNGQRDGQ